jgi:putative choline sulfate-utilization transcription factor
MHTLRKKLPGLNGLVTFEAAARHLNFTEAARELCVSQAAVSRQIRRLEEQLGTALFQRAHRALRLTAAGKRLHDAVTMGLGHIANTASDIASPGKDGQIRVASTVAFATFWLMPRLNGFRQSYPNVDVNVTASDRSDDLYAEGFDIALTCGDKHPPGQDAYFLFTELVYPVCSPDYLKAHPGLKTPEDLLGERLLHLDERLWRDIGWEPIDWSIWLDKCGVRDTPEQHGLMLNNYPMLVQAALDGQGIALGWQHLVGHLLESGRLVRPIEKAWDSQRGFYMIVSANRPIRAEIAALRDWVLASVD